MLATAAGECALIDQSSGLQVRMMRALCTIPDWDRKWNAANRLDDNEPPVVPLLGQLLSGSLLLIALRSAARPPSEISIAGLLRAIISARLV